MHGFLVWIVALGLVVHLGAAGLLGLTGNAVVLLELLTDVTNWYVDPDSDALMDLMLGLVVDGDLFGFLQGVLDVRGAATTCIVKVRGHADVMVLLFVMDEWTSPQNWDRWVGIMDAANATYEEQVHHWPAVANIWRLCKKHTASRPSITCHTHNVSRRVHVAPDDGGT